MIKNTSAGANVNCYLDQIGPVSADSLAEVCKIIIRSWISYFSKLTVCVLENVVVGVREASQLAP